LSKSKLPEKPLTEVELEVMNAIWRLGECTIKEVQAELARERELAYTTVATVMKVLEQKHVIASRKKERVHDYRPLVAKADYEKLSLQHLANNLFDGSPGSMIMRLLGDERLAPEELKKIRASLAERLGDKS